MLAGSNAVSKRSASRLLCIGGPCVLLFMALFGAPATIGVPATGHATEAVRTLKWADLVPPAPPSSGPKLRTFFSRGPAEINSEPGQVDAGPPPPPRPEGRWMSQKSERLSKPAPVVDSLNGKRVKIGGYVVPLDFDATRVKEFLLVPFVGACIHVPPPPANQIIYVKLDNGFEVKSMFEPVYVTGKLATETSFTGLADTGYTLAADKVEIRIE